MNCTYKHQIEVTVLRDLVFHIKVSAKFARAEVVSGGSLEFNFLGLARFGGRVNFKVSEVCKLTALKM